MITGVGSYVPDEVLTNEDLEKIVETSDEWIVSHTGIRERRIASGNLVLRVFVKGMGRRMAERIRQKGYPVTTFRGQGATGPVTSLYIVCRRRDLKKILPVVPELSPDAFYTTEQVGIAPEFDRPGRIRVVKPDKLTGVELPSHGLGVMIPVADISIQSKFHRILLVKGNDKQTGINLRRIIKGQDGHRDGHGVGESVPVGDDGT